MKMLAVAATVAALAATPALAAPATKRAVPQAKPDAMIVAYEGQFVGKDPDLRIRSELLRDAWGTLYGAGE